MIEKTNEYLAEISCGNKNALKELYNLTHSRLISISFFITKNNADAKDIMQETFLMIAKKAHTFKGGNGNKWIEKICRNISLDFLRKRKRNSPSYLSEYEDIPAADTAADRINDKLEIQAALTLLTEKEYNVIVRLYYLDFTFKDTAAALNMKQDTVYKIHDRAIKKLKQLLKEEI